jgi:hypothetical protein
MEEKKKRVRRTRTEEEKKNDYVDNEKLHEELKKYLQARQTNPKLVVTDYIAKSIIKIAERFSRVGKFANYPFIEEMKQDAIFNCIKYLHNYDYEKYSNPHAYFTMYCNNAFMMRIKIEKKELYKKFKMQLNNDSIFGLDYQDMDRSQTILKGTTGDFHKMEQFVDDYEKRNKF